jgi:potassium efflux system protein
LEIQTEASGRVERRRALPEIVAEVRERLSAAQSVPAPSAEQNPDEAEAQRIANRVRVEALSAELDAYNAEIASYEARGRLLPLRLDRANLQVSAAEQNVREIQEAFALRRQAEADSASEDARRLLLEALDAPEAVRERAELLAQHNEDLAAMRTGPDGMLSKIEQTRRSASTIEAETARIIAEQDNVSKRESAVGLNNAVGQLLRTYRANLPARRPEVIAIRLREKEIGEAQIEQIELEERRRELADVPRRVEAILAEANLGAEVSSRQKDELSRLFTELLTTQRSNLDRIWADYDSYITALVELNAQQRKFVETRDNFTSYIDERVLWIRSGSLIAAGDLREGLDALIWLVSIETWSDAVAALVTE